MRLAFLLAALTHPGTVGAVLPSSRDLAQAMAQAAQGAGLLVELGAGTGAITAELRREHPRTPLVAVELQRDLARHLRRRHPGIEVRQQPAHEALAGLADAPADAVVVSSLPFRSLPDELRRPSIEAVCEFLCAGADRRLVQYTYQPRIPFPVPPDAPLQWRRLCTVWRNVPPAGVWELRAG